MRTRWTAEFAVAAAAMAGLGVVSFRLVAAHGSSLVTGHEAADHVVVGALLAGSVGLLALLFVSIRSDLARRGREERARAERDSLFRGIFEGTTDAVLAKDADGRYTMINAAGARLLGRTPAEVVGRTDAELQPEAEAERARRHDLEVLSSGQAATYEDSAVVDGETRHFLSTKAPLTGADGKPQGVFVIARDITHRKRNEANLSALNAALRQRTEEEAAANRELEAFSYSVSHDLRAPLRHINGFVDLLTARGSAGLDDTSRRYLATIAASAKQMGELIDDLLVFSQMGRTEMRRDVVPLSDLVGSLVAHYQGVHQDRRIEWRVSPLPTVDGDRAMLRQAFANLMENAVKYTRTREVAVIEIAAMRGDGDEHVLFIRDNGVGFDMKYVDKLFGVFQRLHRAEDFEGTGIGLANVKRIASRHGGKTRAEGRLGDGATFYVMLPKSRGEAR